MCARDPGPMLHANVDGRGRGRARGRSGAVARVVHTSSATTIGERAGEIGREDTHHRGSFMSNYERSKFLGERRVLALGEELGLAGRVREPLVGAGPGSHRVGRRRLLLDIVNGRCRCS